MKLNRITALAALVLMSSQAAAFEEEFLDVVTDETLGGGFEVPEVLTATRLKQPRSEVPGSVTVIDAEQIRQWGVRTLPELMRFVPGMFVKHGAADAVAYHASNPNLMRRMQVLIDGRSVYRAGIASVVWDDIPLALEDIQRIEVFRGPNASSYGANAFMAVVNIVTLHPQDTLGSRGYIRGGNQATRDAYVSHSSELGDGAIRITASRKSDDGFDGQYARDGEDDYHDGGRDQFINLTYSERLDNGDQLLLESAYKWGETEIPPGEFDGEPPEDYTRNGFLYGRLTQDVSARHSRKLQAYWQIENRRHPAHGCVPTVSLDTELTSLYREDPYWAAVVGRLIPGAYLNQEDDPATYAQVNGLVQGIAAGVLTPETVELALETTLERDYDISQSDLDAAQGIFGRAFNGSDFEQLGEVICGSTSIDFEEQRVDLEWQDTVHWNDRLRTVSGVSFRRDQVYSETYFHGTVRNDIFRVFGNVEWRPFAPLLLHVGGMYETEDTNDSAFSPRVAANFMLSPQQSVRLVWSTAVRSPDLLEQEPNYYYTIGNLDDNYLGLTEGDYFEQQTGTYGQLDHEKIQSVELGYFLNVPEYNFMADIKVYRDYLTQLISNPINLTNPDVYSDTEMVIKGVDWQFSWNPAQHHSFWWSGAYVNTDVEIGEDSAIDEETLTSLLRVETRLSAEYSNNLSWAYRRGDWGLTQSYFWHNAYNRENRNPRHYRRYEANLTKDWKMDGYTVNTGLFWHHLIDDGRVIYINEVYSVNDLWYLQVGLEF